MTPHPNSNPTSWQNRAQAKKRQQQDSIPPEWVIDIPKDRQNVMHVPYECRLLTPAELEITDTTDVEMMLNMLRDGKWKSVDVTRAFYKRAIIAHQAGGPIALQTNCLTEIFIERALARATEMDEYLERNKKPKGPLHGLPVSLKDQFRIKGLEIINGYVANIGDYATKNSVLVDVLNELGAVPFVRTNLPQTLMWGETYNNVFGRTLNPHNRSLTPGGSSGGEGALLAMRGSPLGVGTDIGGSVRIPASASGIYSLRPSYARFPYYGVLGTRDGQDSVLSVLGPMSNSISGLKVFTKAVIDSRPWLRDPQCLPMTWNEEAYQLIEHGGRGGRKCFGLMYDNGLVKPHPPVVRAIHVMKQALEAAGHEVIEWKNDRHKDILVNLVQVWNADGHEDFKRECERSGEPHIPSMDPTVYSHDLPDLGTSASMTSAKPLTAYELWQLHKEKLDLRKEYLDCWQSTESQTTTGRPIDAIISPSMPFAAPPHGKNIYTFYTSIWNALDYTVGVLPVTSVDPKLDQPAPPHEFYNDRDRDIYQMYKPEVFENGPVGLQVVGKRLEEEVVLGIMEEVQEALKKYVSPGSKL
ncbi:amidase [Ceratobasidium sp. AG-Ba]|nr:amidase [Ceratobasidium sp. AG-Ba]QRW09429.1 amidase [Ceratobasidium sp. AG-Ba]